MFIRLPRGRSNLVISLHGRALDIIRLPDDSASKGHRSIGGFNVALVVIHDLSKPPSYYCENPNDEYWDSFTQLAEAETDNRMVDEPLHPLLTDICAAIIERVPLYDLNDKRTFISYKEAIEK